MRKGRRSSLRHLLRLLCAFAPAPAGTEDADILASVPRIYTRQGDDGTTGLLYGGRVSKADPVTEACGTVDEAVASFDAEVPDAPAAT